MSNAAFKSFRSRYMLVAMTAIVVSFIFIASVENYIRTANQASLQNIALRHSVSQLNKQLSDEIHAAGRKLDLYLFTPNSVYRKEYSTHITNAKVIANSLVRSDWITTHNLKDKIQKLKKHLQRLQKETFLLYRIRLDGEQMYPAMRLANGSMRSENISIVSLINAAIYELQLDEKYNTQIYSTFLELRDHWRRTINAYRLYLINRLSSLSESNLTGQSTDIRNYYQSFIKKLTLLSKNTNPDDIGIDTEIALTEIIPSAQTWLEGFNEVDEINKTSAWRADVPIVLNTIYPLFDELYSIISKIDLKISDTASIDIKFQQTTSQEITYTLWGIEGLLIILTLFGYFVIDMVLLKPLYKLSTALNSNSNNNFEIHLPQTNTKEVKEFFEAYQNMQSQIKARQDKLEHIAMHDSLTNLPNRSLLMSHINLAISNATRNGLNFAIIILDLDRFKEVNDSLGHLIGDEVLKQVAMRLQSLLRDSDTVARLGGDEFAMLLPGIEEKTIIDIAIKISNELEKVYVVEEHNLYLGASQGVAIYPQHGETTNILIKNADIAMYLAKKSDISYVIFAPKSDKKNTKQLSLLSDLRQAIDLDQLRLFYQPIYSSQTDSMIGFEALLRWQHPSFDLLPPDSFIQLAEQTGLIKKITLWVIDNALKTFKTFPIIHENFYISVNVTAWDLQDNYFIEFLEQSIIKNKVQPHCLMLELSERSMMADSNRIQMSLNKLKTLGVKIAIDDFGTGFSSLAILKQLPVSILKIDKSFVLKMATDKNDSLIVNSIIDLAHNLELKVIAEGVEDVKSRNVLKEINCDYFQGYLFSMPLNEKDTMSLLKVLNSKLKVVD